MILKLTYVKTTKKTKNKTVLFITHRLSTIKMQTNSTNASGKVEEIGTHKELMEKGERYARLYAHQGEE